MHRLALAGLLVAMFSVLGAGRVQAASVEKSTSVRDVDHPARHPFQAVCNGTTAICIVTRVPVGQRLVIQGATIHGLLVPATGSAVWASILTTVNGVLVSHTFGMQDLGPVVGAFGNPNAYIGTVPFPLYADPDTNVTVVVSRGFVTLDSISLRVTISGYTVSVE